MSWVRTLEPSQLVLRHGCHPYLPSGHRKWGTSLRLLFNLPDHSCQIFLVFNCPFYTFILSRAIKWSQIISQILSSVFLSEQKMYNLCFCHFYNHLISQCHNLSMYFIPCHFQWSFESSKSYIMDYPLSARHLKYVSDSFSNLSPIS